MTQTGIPSITGTTRERVVVALFSLPLAAVCIWALITGEFVLRDSAAGSTPARTFVFAVFRFLSTEVFAAASAFLLLAFAWAVFRPRWISRLLLHLSRHLWRFVCLLLFAILVFALVGSILEYVV